MTSSNKQESSNGPEYIRLSKNEALYRPSKRAITITVAAMAAAVVLAVVVFILFPLPA